MKNGTIASMQTLAMVKNLNFFHSQIFKLLFVYFHTQPQNKIIQSNEDEANEPDDTIDLTDDPEDQSIENEIKSQGSYD